MESRIFKTALLVLFLLLNGCEINEPTNPTAVSNGSLTIDNNTPPDTQSRYARLFPLAEGARWEYSFLQHYQITDTYMCGFCNYHTYQYGILTLEVTRAYDREDSKDYRVEINLKIDSLYHVQSYPSEFWGSDTSYVNLNVQDTTYYFGLTVRNDTVWYRDETNELRMITPQSYEERSSVNMYIFNVPLVGPMDTDIPGSALSFHIRDTSTDCDSYDAIFDSKTGVLKKYDIYDTYCTYSSPYDGTRYSLYLRNYTPGEPQE